MSLNVTEQENQYVEQIPNKNKNFLNSKKEDKCFTNLVLERF